MPSRDVFSCFFFSQYESAFFFNRSFRGSRNLRMLKKGTTRKYMMNIRTQVCALAILCAKFFHALKNFDIFFIYSAQKSAYINGAMLEPSKNIMIEPTATSRMIRGISHHFFSFFKNVT